MRKLILIISLILAYQFCFAQVTPKVMQRSNSTVTVQDDRLWPRLNFLLPRYKDTLTANLSGNIGLDSAYALMATRDNKVWIRYLNPKRWVEFGRSDAYLVADSIILGPSLRSTPKKVGTDPTTLLDIYADSVHFLNDENNPGPLKYYGTDAFNNLKYNDVRDFGRIDNILNETRNVNLNGYLFSIQGSNSTTTFLPDGSIKFGTIGKLLPSPLPTNELDFVESDYDTSGIATRQRSLKFYSYVPIDGATHVTKNTTDSIWSSQGGILDATAAEAFIFRTPTISVSSQPTLINVGGFSPLTIGASGNGAMPPIIDIANIDSAKRGPIGTYGASMVFSSQKQGYAKQYLARIDVPLVDSGTSTSKANWVLSIDHNNTLTERLRIDNLGNITVNKFVGAGGTKMVTTDNNGLLSYQDIPSGGTGSALTNVGSGFRLLKPGSQTMKTVTATSPLAYDSVTTDQIGLTIADGIADGATKGVVSFTAADFNSSSGNISIDYTNGQAASGSTKGFVTSADWTTFNTKQAPISESDDGLAFSSNVLSTATTFQTITYGSPNSTFSNSTSLNGVLTLTGNTTLVISSPQNGKTYIIKFVQGGSGSYTVVLPGGGSPSLSTAVGSATYLAGTWDGTDWLWNIASSSTGTLTSFTATDGNGFDFSVANSTSTPTLTLTTTVSNNQVITSNSGALAGSASLTFSSNTLGVGAAGSALGKITQSGNTSGTITFQPQAAAGTYNWNWPTTAGTAGYFLTSQGGGSTALTWTDPTAIITIGSFGSSPNANGLSWASSILRMQPADGTNPGGVSTTSQTIAGQKTFTGGIISNASGVTKLSLTGNMSGASEPGTFGSLFAIQSLTYTDGGSARTVSNGQNLSLIDYTTLAATNAVTYSGDVSTLRITGAPAAGTNVTFTGSAWALYIASGVAYVNSLAGSVNVQSGDFSLGTNQFDIYTGTGGNTFTLPARSLNPGLIKRIKNAGSGNLTVARAGSDNIYETSSVTSITIPAGESRSIVAGLTSTWYVFN